MKKTKAGKRSGFRYVAPKFQGRVEILETLRDARQMIADVDVKSSEMLRYIKGQIDLGVSLVEIGFAVDPFTQELARKVRDTGLTEKLAIFGRTASSDLEDIAIMAELGIKNAVLVAKSRLMDVKNDLQITPEKNLRLIQNSVRYLKDGGFFVVLDLEFATDAVFGRKEYGAVMRPAEKKANRDYFFKVVEAGIAGGADRLVVCDTSGGALPMEIGKLFDFLTSVYPKSAFGIHCHNDFGLAVANTMEAILHGAVHAQVVMNGYGERAGNTDASPLYALFQERIGRSLVAGNLQGLSDLAEDFSVSFGLGRDTSSSVTGRNVCSTAAGMHQAGNNKAPGTYLPFNPLSYGNISREMVNRQSGSHSIIAKSKQVGVILTKEQAEIFKEKFEEMIRCSAFEVSDDAFVLACWIVRGEFQPFFQIKEFEARSVSDGNGGKKLARGNVKLLIGKKEKHEVKDGNGPYDALSKALRKALKWHYPTIRDAVLRSYQLKAIEVSAGGSGSVVRVVAEFADNHGKTWSSVGISTDSNEAGFRALVSGLEFYLFTTNAENKHIKTDA